jgi:hypothetical protein
VVAGEGEDLGRGLAAHELRPADVQVRRGGDGLPRRVVRPVGGVRTDHVEGGTRPVRADRQHAGGGLHAVAAQQQRGVDAVATQQGEQLVAECIGADGTGAAHGGAELGEHERGAAGRAGRGHPDLLDDLAALPLRDRLHGADEGVQDVHAQ